MTTGYVGWPSPILEGHRTIFTFLGSIGSQADSPSPGFVGLGGRFERGDAHEMVMKGLQGNRPYKSLGGPQPAQGLRAGIVVIVV
jgi:hypothetical protein